MRTLTPNGLALLRDVAAGVKIGATLTGKLVDAGLVKADGGLTDAGKEQLERAKQRWQHNEDAGQVREENKHR